MFIELIAVKIREDTNNRVIANRLVFCLSLEHPLFFSLSLSGSFWFTILSLPRPQSL